ncbi:MAG: tRNA preQ1(34) S-adenosylmethionine ribosyltransferase-isomerase QueA [Pyrinomonadaceae bacterium]
MLISEFDFELPDELIAQQPLRERDASRMLVLDRAANSWTDSAFLDLPKYLRAGDLLVVNNTRVFPARLVGKRDPSGGQVELFLIREEALGLWVALARPARKLSVGSRVEFGDRRLMGEIVGELDEGKRLVQFSPAETFRELLEEIGQTPLPPYIRRDEPARNSDRERYQTVYARESGAIAAPTAGLHFTPKVFDAVKAAAAEIAGITLHVGYGTFEPVRATDTGSHRVSPESFEISEAAAEQINRAKREERRVIAVGTTTVRALEAASQASGTITGGAGQAEITIVPGYEFRIVDGLVTNFHLPKSSLLLLVSAFAGTEFVLGAYRHAVAGGYRFYSYGDCMLII